MVELLVFFVQCVCLIGYLYGAWLVITHRAHTGPMCSHEAGSSPLPGAEDELAWRNYLAYDS